jgi:hypothetical protein
MMMMMMTTSIHLLSSAPVLLSVSVWPGVRGQIIFGFSWKLALELLINIVIKSEFCNIGSIDRPTVLKGLGHLYPHFLYILTKFGAIWYRSFPWNAGAYLFFY